MDANVNGGTPAAFWYREEGHVFVLPLILRDIPDSDLRDAVSPYGYSGPVSDASHEDTAFWRRACDQMIETLGANGVVTTFVRLHPLLPVPLDVLGGAGAVIQHGETVSVDLSLSLEEMWRETRRDHRNHINRARRAGVEVVFDDWERLDEWVAVYHENMQRLGASTVLLLPPRAPGCPTRRGRGPDAPGGGARRRRGGRWQHVLRVRRNDPRVRRLDPARRGPPRRRAAVRRGAAVGKDRGNAIFHLGGGVGGAKDSLFSYKAGFSSGRHPFHTWRVVTRPARPTRTCWRVAG